MNIYVYHGPIVAWHFVRILVLFSSLLLAAMAHAQDDRRVRFGAGLEYTAKAPIWPTQGSPYRPFGGYFVWGAAQIQPAYGERGFIANIRAGYFRDDAKYAMAEYLLLGVDRGCIRVELEGLIPTRSEVFYWSIGIGTDWNVQVAPYFLIPTAAGNPSAHADPDLYRIDRDLFAARRLLIPHIVTGPAFRIPTGDGKSFVAQLLVRQAFLDAFEQPVAVTVRPGLGSTRSVLVSQRPTYFGVSMSYFF